MTPLGRLRLSVVKYSVEWAPLLCRIFEPLRIVYPFHVIDDDSVDNVGGFISGENKVVPVGPRVAPFYANQYLRCVSSSNSSISSASTK